MVQVHIDIIEFSHIILHIVEMLLSDFVMWFSYFLFSIDRCFHFQVIFYDTYDVLLVHIYLMSKCQKFALEFVAWTLLCHLIPQNILY